VGLLHAKVVEERHHLRAKVGNAPRQAVFTPDIEGDGTEVARKRRHLFEPGPTSEAEPVDLAQERTIALDILVYAGIVREHHGHGAASTFSRVKPPSLPTQPDAGLFKYSAKCNDRNR
jgi:hypothetical protein